MANTITINFTPCEPAPVGGYRVRYQVNGGSVIEVGPFTESPIVIEAEGGPGDCYDGFLFSDCGGGKIGDLLGFSACAEPAPSVSVSEPPIACNVENNGCTGTTIDNLSYGGIPLVHWAGENLPIAVGESGCFSLPYTTSGDTLTITALNGSWTQIRVTDNAGDHFLPFSGTGIYFQTLTINPMFPILQIEIIC